MAFIEAHDLVRTYAPKGSPVVRALDGLDLGVAVMLLIFIPLSIRKFATLSR